MTKLGLAIQVTQTGNDGARIINDDSWSRLIVDLRELLPMLHNEGIYCYNIPALFSYTEEGMFITLVREIKGRGKDNSCAFIYVPKDIEITGDELYDVVCTVKKEICKSSWDIIGLKELFNKEYRKKEVAVEYNCSQNNGFAYRMVPDKYSLKELLGEERYQEYYTNYKYVFILEEKDFCKREEMDNCEKESGLLIDLTSRELETYCSLIPPTQAEITRATQLNILIENKNGEPFNKVIKGLKGKQIRLTIARPGFENVSCKHVLTKLGERINLNKLKEIEWEKKISIKNFNFISQVTKEHVEGCEIIINDVNVTSSAILLTEGALKNVQVTIKHPDFATVTRQINFKINNIVEIELIPKEKTYEYDVCLKGRFGSAKLTFTTRDKISRSQSPLYFYNLRNDSLIFDRQKLRKMKNKSIGIGFVSGIIISMLIGLIIVLCRPSQTNATDNKVIKRVHNEISVPSTIDKHTTEDSEDIFEKEPIESPKEKPTKRQEKILEENMNHKNKEPEQVHSQDE